MQENPPGLKVRVMDLVKMGGEVRQEPESQAERIEPPRPLNLWESRGDA